MSPAATPSFILTMSSRDAAHPENPAPRQSDPRPGWIALGAVLIGLAVPCHAQNLPPLTDVERLAVGERHACVLTEAGGVKCWGANNSGQLGNDSTTTSHVPVDVVGLASGVVSVSAGREHTCAVTQSGGVKCWGRNFLGQLGDGTTTNRLTPVDVSGFAGDIVAVSGGSGHSCALGSSGELYCWGYNRDGQLGIGSTENQTTPVLVLGQGVAAVTTGFANTCQLSTNGAVSCWGVYDRVCNSLGCGFDFVVRPTPVSGLGSGVAAVSAGEYFNCALSTDGGVKCWGDNFDGQLGDLGTTDPDPFTLFDIDGLETNVVGIVAAYDHACATLVDGTVKCWGKNRSGQLGDGTGTDRFPPVMVDGLDGVAGVGAGRAHTCARTAAGGVQCWGSNASGQLGDDDPWFRLEPTPVPGLVDGVAAISVGDSHSCALTAAGAVKCWGGNGSGQVGDGSTEPRSTPVTVSGLDSGATRISAGRAHTCAIADGGAVLCWGDNEMAQIGNGDTIDQSSPVVVDGLDSGMADVAGGEFHTCARTGTGGAKCWGLNIDGQLGNGNISLQTPPVDVFGLGSGVSSITAGGYHTCAIVSGAIVCWGDNDDGQIGDDTTEDAVTAVTLDFPTSATTVSAGLAHTCAVTGAGEALCWGNGDAGQLGNGFSFGIQKTPMGVLGLHSGVATISAGISHSCAVTTGGEALCWGSNAFGQLGDGGTAEQTAPVGVSGLSTGQESISAGSTHTCALSVSGGVSCWGSNQSHQLGIGRRDNRLPGPVLFKSPIIFNSGFEADEAP